MVAPLIGAAARMGAKKLAEKEAKRRAQMEAAKESVKEGAKTTAKAAGATGAAGATYLVGESMSPSGSGPAIDAIRKMQRESRQKEIREEEEMNRETRGMKKGGMASASKRADGCAVKGKTKGRFV
jgi:hypothetical protein